MKKKILIRIGSLRHGGAEKVLVTFLKNLSPEKYEIDLLLNLYSGKYLKEVPSWINIYYLNKGEMITTNRIQDIPEKAFRVIYQSILKKFPKLLYRFILPNKTYDIEFAAIHGIADEILNSPIKSSKKIVWIHNDLSNIPEYTEMRLKTFFGFDKILVISSKINQLFLDIASTEEQKEKIVRIYNPIDVNEILELSKQPCELKKNSDVKTFVSIGTVFPQKGFDRLLRVHRRLLDEGYQHNVWIVGDGYDFPNIKKLFQVLKVEETAKLIGFKENPYPYFTQADYYILSSRYEGYPTVLFEAMVLAKPIIATDVSGVREMLNDGELGYIITNDEDDIYNGMKYFLENPEEAEKYTKIIQSKSLPFELSNAVESIEKHF
ncbi:Glycosyltransferase involved in cell wall bisynthesis [Algoriella xinjiangensis]|uniref:Glycosyltransferase involved in cell wall bisynthesis n=1 Tax=Algoriella xinjiangensis TaxID=684065 RepID=A0A1I4VH99_9FLAO|nr:glycosyltransferase [Algoriella xinjiangensis]SFN00592.1 Glycosyltransferase involved in cell wall bisynthesis [Algoriella xinjiangensis]VDH17171.1 Probable poly(glycerol-phosphate) alpha-glucosyltransferase [Algoriella xinjiangensis]